MPAVDALKKFRTQGYGSTDAPTDPKESSAGPRVIKLTDEEVKGLAQYGQSGEEVTCEIHGRVNGSELAVTSVSAPGGGGGQVDANADAEAVMAKMRGPMTQMQTMPSPS